MRKGRQRHAAPVERLLYFALPEECLRVASLGTPLSVDSHPKPNQSALPTSHNLRIAAVSAYCCSPPISATVGDFRKGSLLADLAPVARPSAAADVLQSEPQLGIRNMSVTGRSKEHTPWLLACGGSSSARGRRSAGHQRTVVARRTQVRCALPGTQRTLSGHRSKRCRSKAGAASREINYAPRCAAFRPTVAWARTFTLQTYAKAPPSDTCKALPELRLANAPYRAPANPKPRTPKAKRQRMHARTVAWGATWLERAPGCRHSKSSPRMKQGPSPPPCGACSVQRGSGPSLSAKCCLGTIYHLLRVA